MSQVVGSNNSYKPITNTAWVRAQLCKLQKGCARLAAASDKVYQLLAQGRWFSLGTPASSKTKTGRHDIADILLKVALNTEIQNSNSEITFIMYDWKAKLFKSIWEQETKVPKQDGKNRLKSPIPKINLQYAMIHVYSHYTIHLRT